MPTTTDTESALDRLAASYKPQQADPEAESALDRLAQPQREMGWAETAGRAGGTAATGAVRMGGLAASTIARAADAVMSGMGVKTNLEESTFRGMDKILTPMHEMYDVKPGETTGTGVTGLAKETLGALASIPFAMLSWPEGGIEKAEAVLARGGTREQAILAGGATAAVGAAQQLLPAAAGTKIATKVGGTLAARAAGAATGAGISIGTGAAGREIENLTTPSGMTDLQQQVMPSPLEALKEAVPGAIFGIAGAGEGIHAAAKEAKGKGPSAVEQMRAVAGEEHVPAGGIEVRPASKEEVEEIRGAPAPKEKPPTGGVPREPEEQIQATLPKSEKQAELERIRDLAATPEAQAHIDKMIAAEEKSSRASWEKETKQLEAQAGGDELRRLALQTGMPELSEAFRARAEKLAPEQPAAAGEGRPEPTPPGETLERPETAPVAAPAPPPAPPMTQGRSPLFRAIHDELGGINTSERSDTGFDKAKAVMLGGKGPTGKTRSPLFNSNGATMDRVVEWMHGRGYITQADIDHWDQEMPGGSHQLARDMIQEEAKDPGSVRPLREQDEQYAAMTERERQDQVMREAEVRDIQTRGRTLEDIERDVASQQDAELAQQHGLQPHELFTGDTAAIHRANAANPDAVERLAMQHENDHAAFMQGVRRINANAEAAAGRRAGNEPTAGRPGEQPAIRGEHPAAAEVRAGQGAVRGEPVAGEPGPGERAAARQAVPGAGAERGGPTGYQAGEPVTRLATAKSGGLPHIFDREALARKTLAAAGHPLAGTESMAPEHAGMLEESILRGARESFDENGKFIGKPYSVATAKGSYQFNTLEQARDFAETTGMKAGTRRQLQEAGRPAPNIEQANVQSQGYAHPERANEPVFQLAHTVPEQERMKAALAERAAETRRQLENAPPAEDFRLTGSSRAVDELEARGQKPLFMKRAMAYVAKAAKGKATLEDAHGAMEAHVDNIKGWLARHGLDFTHAENDYRVDPTMREGQAANVVYDLGEGRWKARFSPELLAEHPNIVSQTMLHEHVHIMDWMGQLYSNHPDMHVQRGGTDAVPHAQPVGQVAKELFRLYDTHPDFRRFFRYPLDDYYATLHENPREMQAELFAQAAVAYHTPLKEAMQREAPTAARFIEQAFEHARSEGVTPRGGAEGLADLRRLVDSFSDARSEQRNERPAVNDLEHSLAKPLGSRLADRDDEAAKFRDILNRSFTPAELKRMREANAEEDRMLASGKEDPKKGFASLPNEQREAMEYLIGRGHDPTTLLGYTPYQGVAARTQAPEKTGLAATLQKVFAPATRGPIAEAQANIMRANYGVIAREREMALEQLKGIAAEMSKWPVQKMVAFIDSMERGKMLGNQREQAMADQLRKFLDDKRDEVRALGTGALEHFMEHYFPHIWKEHEEAQQLFGRRPLTGSEAFRKQRTIPYMADGMRWRAYDKDGDFIKSFATEKEAQAAMPEGGRVGKPLTPITSNPVELALLKSREMDRYIAGQRIFSEMKDAGMARFVPFGSKQEPPGWRPIDDKIARAIEKTPEGPVKRGQYYAPEQATTLINNHLSPGMQGNSFFQAWRGIGNALNQVQLGLSFFHAGFTSFDSMVSRVALGTKQISRGLGTASPSDVVKGFGNVVMGSLPSQPFLNAYKGDRLLQAYLGKLDSPEMAPIVDAIQQAGGRIKMDDFYRNVEVNSFKEAIRNGSIWYKPHLALGYVLDKANAPVMQWLVPRQKLGVFFDMAKDWLDTHQDASFEGRRAALSKMWDSVDNRMGQLVYDNLFWNRTLKDGLMASVRSVGWNLGTFREIGGGIKDAFDLKQIVKDKSLSDRTSYVIALPLLAGVYGAMTQALYGQGPPKELKDLFFPRTGKTRPDGSEDRVSLPTYMRDVYAYAKDIHGAVAYGENPAETLLNKANPLIASVAQMFEGRDYYGAAIRNPGDDGVRQMADWASWVASQTTPFSIRNYMQQKKLSGDDPSVPGYMLSPQMLGVTPAPGYITKSPEQIESGEVAKLRDPLIKKFREELQGGAYPADVVQRARSAGLSARDIRYLLRSSGPTPVQHRLRSFGEQP